MGKEFKNSPDRRSGGFLRSFFASLRLNPLIQEGAETSVIQKERRNLSAEPMESQ